MTARAVTRTAFLAGVPRPSALSRAGNAPQAACGSRGGEADGRGLAPGPPGQAYPGRKQYFVGASTAATILANRMAPALPDRYLARTGAGGRHRCVSHRSMQASSSSVSTGLVT